MLFTPIATNSDTLGTSPAQLLSEHHSETELDRQLTRMRRAASALVRHTRREIDIVTHALLRYGTLDNDQIAELLAT